MRVTINDNQSDIVGMKVVNIIYRNKLFYILYEANIENIFII